MKINLNHQFKTLGGKEYDKVDQAGNLIEPHHMAKCLGLAMWQFADKNMKFKLWAESLYKTGEMEIDNVDFDLIVAWLENYGTDPQKQWIPWFCQVGIKGQVIDSIKEQKEGSETKLKKVK